MILVLSYILSPKLKCSVRVDLTTSGAFTANEAGGIYIVTTSGRFTMDAEL